MLRILPILAAFAVGAALSSVTWLLLRPTTAMVDREIETVQLDDRADARPPGAAGAVAPSVGVPPDVVTPAMPAARAGERRALARAIERLEQLPAAPSPTIDHATLEVLAESVRAKLQARLQRGERP